MNIRVITIYGIKNCDTVKKACAWLKTAGIEYRFHDYKKDGVDRLKLQRHIKEFGWEKVLNRKGTTWRKLSSDQQAGITDASSAVILMKEKPSIIKRPIIDLGSKQLLGFNEDEYIQTFKNL